MDSTIIASIIGALGAILAVFIQDYLRRKRPKKIVGNSEIHKRSKLGLIVLYIIIVSLISGTLFHFVLMVPKQKPSEILTVRDTSQNKAIQTTADKPSRKGPLPGTDIVIFNACDLKSAHTLLRDILRNAYPGAKIDAFYNWKDRFQKEKTEIFYITESFKSDAIIIEDLLPELQDVIDYKSTNYFGLENRNIAIFVGNDYRNYLRIPDRD